MEAVLLKENEAKIYEGVYRIGEKVRESGIKNNQFFFTNRVISENENEAVIYFEKNFNLHNLGRTIIECEFNEAENNFGVLGNKFLMNFYLIMNGIALQNVLIPYAEKLVHALHILIEAAVWNYGCIERGYLSFASHVNGFFTRWVDMKSVKEVFEERYSIYKPIVKKILEGNEKPILQNIEKELTLLKMQAIRSFEVRKLEFPNKSNLGNPDILLRSKFHLTINDNLLFRKYMNENLDFLASRLFTIFFYLYNKKIGVKNIDRYLLAYLIYRGVEDMYGLNAIEIISNFK